MRETSGSVFGKLTEKWEDDVEKAKAAEAFLQRRRRELKARITAIRRKRKISPKEQQEKKPARPEKQAASLVPADNRDIKALPRGHRSTRAKKPPQSLLRTVLIAKNGKNIDLLSVSRRKRAQRENVAQGRDGGAAANS
ncbi:hypothetical protein CGCSCA4_v012189 [Colletotrichum siamense]|uniref:Uncharacterized protein n=1 Tax=Colletotrichum siamense TaxID=690259 RepID=A0A9P5BY18_COLSI|nr:hypothetical protein CGCSCA4_v012189 [Colletotrichum siamense]KAF4850759.1 hypothetical protein CGCSCA2_v011280 [Colletotrichum siamense]